MLVALVAASARADIVRTSTSVTFSGFISNSAGPVSVEATLSVDPLQPDFLNLLLVNTSTAPTPNPVGLLTSFYFGVYSGTTSGSAPALTYVSGSGQVYMASRYGPDIPGVWHPPVVPAPVGSGSFQAMLAPGVLSDLRATKKGDYTWQLRQNLSLVASEPPLNFGIGTVGNSSLSPNGFDGDVVDGNDFGIYVGDATSQSLQSVGLVVSGSAWFRFSGFGDYTIANIPDHAVFGLGSGPDLVVSVPEPGSAALAAIGACATLGWRLRRRARRLRCALRSTALAVIAGIVVVALLFAVPARAAPVPVADWNFGTGTSGLGWTSQTFSSLNPSVAVTGSYWDYWKTPSGPAAYWHVDPKRGAVPPSWIVNTLTSPVITVPQQADALDFIIRQRFNFPKDIQTGAPLVVGQLAWRYYDPQNLAAPFQPFAPSVFATGTVPPPYNALSPIPTWVASNYLTGTFGVPPLAAGGGAWVGSSPGWAQHDFVMSQVTLDGGLQPGLQVQFRFVNAILGVQCNGSEWDVSRVTVIGQLPEPGGVALAVIGLGSAAVAVVTRGRRRLTSGPRARA